MNAPIYFDGFENAPELREALIAYLESASRTLTLHDVCHWFPDVRDPAISP
ncbi:MAG: hypothetical protein JO165_02210 [Candidatus Eremiobacteraeota bacterium]|nr:hypothetical protein [Candidatus Eremiobacteraeota bacterium]